MVVARLPTYQGYSAKRNDIRLNFCPIVFDKTTYDGYEIPYQDKDQLSDLRSQYAGSIIFHRSGTTIQCVPIDESVPKQGKPKIFDISRDISLTRAISHTALLNLFASKGNEFASVYPVSKMILRKEELLSKIYSGKMPEGVLYAYPAYEFESRAIIPFKESVKYGFLLNFSVYQGFSATVAKLTELGVNVIGRYVEFEHSDSRRHPLQNPEFDRRLAGKVVALNGQKLSLSDYRDVSERPATECYLEPRGENIDLCISSIIPGETDSFHKRQEAFFKIKGAKYAFDRLTKIIQWLKDQGPIKCSRNLSFTFTGSSYLPSSGRDAGKYRFVSNPDCVLRPGGSITVKWPVERYCQKLCTG